MNKEVTDALHLLTGKTNLSDVSVTEFEQLVTRYPYFSAVQLLLLKKMQAEKHQQLEQHLHKTALYFPDQSWLQYLLLDWKDDKEEAISTIPEHEKENTSLINEAHPEQNFEPENDVLENEEPENTEDENLIKLPAENILEEIPVITIDNVHDEPEELPLTDEDAAAEASPLPIDESQQKIASILSEQAGEFQKPVNEKENVLIESEPFHTVDYFASQGIDIEERKEETGFDTKVHKFTDWLRRMKRINPHPIDLGTDSEQEIYVANIAASSNQTKEIVTESMAEVLLKQHKNEKAIEIYQKLSLLYPLKNTYFATLIEQIKQ